VNKWELNLGQAYRLGCCVESGQSLAGEPHNSVFKVIKVIRIINNIINYRGIPKGRPDESCRVWCAEHLRRGAMI
jgi:hypothetical protein